MSKSQVPAVTIKPAYTIREYCEAFGSGRTKTYEEIKTGQLRAYKNGKKTLIAGVDALARQEALRNQAA